jgi:hypothetical protein
MVLNNQQACWARERLCYRCGDLSSITTIALPHSLERTIPAGLVLLIAIIVVVGTVMGKFVKPAMPWATFLMG